MPIKDHFLFYLDDMANMTIGQQRRIRRPAFAAFYRQSVEDVIDVLDKCGLTYWFAEGCLIWLLRYGTNHPEEIDDVVDDDVDVMVEVASADEWLEIFPRVRALLKEKGWRRFAAYPYPERKGLQPSKFKAWNMRLSPLLAVGLDLMMYIRRPGADTVYIHHGTPDGLFSAWGGQMPASFIYPLGKACCYGRAVPCPARPRAVLSRWNGGEYEEEKLPYPLREISVAEKVFIDRRADELRSRGFFTLQDGV